MRPKIPRTLAAAWAMLISFSLCVPVYSQDTPSEESVELTIEKVLEDFDVVWKAISEDYVDEDYGGLDWNAMKAEYRSKIAEAENPGEAYLYLGEMVSRLENPGTVVVPPWLRPAQPADDNEPMLEYGGVGILLQELDNGDVMVLQVFRQTPAEKAGVLVGDVVVRVNDWSVTGENRIAAIADRVRGPVETTVSITLREPGGTERTLGLSRARIDLRPSVEHRVLQGNYGYLRIPVLSKELVQQGGIALPRLLSTGGLILDLRSVSGGDIEAMVQLAQWFLGAGNMGGIVARGGGYALPGRPDAVAAYQRPMIVLTNPGTYGIGEILTALLSEYRRATIVGNETAGGFDMGAYVELPSGGALRMTVGLYITPKGQILPPMGIDPDFPVDPPDLETIRQGKDVYIEQAIKTLDESKKR